MESATIAQCLGILRCPITGNPLSILTPEELAENNRRLEARTVLHRDGTPARTPLTFALGTPQRSEIYRVEDSIVWLLADLALVAANAIQTASIAAEKKVVQSFYDEYGWVKSESGLFNDTVQFTDTRACAQAYQRYCNTRIGRELSGGKYLLDVASGSIPHTEYLEFSRHYDVRICVDFSIRALREARAKLGDAGLYLLGDITRLPLASGAVDAVISLHTVYHVPQTEQTAAVDELVRVTKPGGRVVIVYVWASSVAMNFSFALRRKLGRIKHALRPKGDAVACGTSSASATPPLYFSPQNHNWFAREIAGKHGAKLRVWSAVSMLFQIHFFSDHGFGRLTLALVKKFEDYFPRLAGRYGQYPMFVIDKTSS
ncbi:MAG TPA: class I SAM-dependent methyltransferase [Opitutaceae bacterium]|jgi:SAM-dependent methyltransferase/uncharacterized protein YbaR (Trm112 family)|nr:class I SAM-dependent methyltransferase [Opitutaceae bacterium]